jgi:putative NADH-flavin reductase
MTPNQSWHPKNVVVFGSGGQTGKLIVDEALSKGYKVTAFMRHPEKSPLLREGLTLFHGDVLDQRAVEQSLEGADAVVSALGWAKDSPKNLLTASGQTILNAMQKQGIQRFVTVLGAAVDDPTDPPATLSRRLIVSLIRRLEPDLLMDSQYLTEAIRASDREWVIVRVPRLANGPKTETYRYGQLDLGFGAIVRRADLAHFMVQQLTQNDFVRQAPMIAS